MARMVVVGGEVAGRGLWGGKRSGPEWAGLAVAVLIALIVLLSSGPISVLSLLGAAAVLLVGTVLSTPNRFTGDRSLGALLVEDWHKRARDKKGTSSFVPVKDRPQTRRVKAPKSRRAEADEDGMIEVPIRHRNNGPLMVGNVRHFVYESPDGPMVIFRHQGKVKKPYYTVTVETLGTSSGIREEHQEDAGHVAHGLMLSRLARRQQLVTHVQSLARAVPVDVADHLYWIQDRIPKVGIPKVLLQSYGGLCDLIQDRGEQHRTYETFRIPMSEKLARKASQLGEGEQGYGKAIYQEIKSAMSQAEMMGSVQAFRPLGPKKMAALLRHLQDPDFDIDDTTDADLMDCWQHLDGVSSKSSVIVNDKWHTRTGYVPAAAFSPEAIPVNALKAVISGIQPAVEHSVSIVMELQDARSARGQARSHAAMDRAKKKQTEKSGVVTDGSEDVLLNASSQRLLDLRPGSGFHGAAYGLYISFSVRQEEEILSTTDIIEAAAADAGIERIDWLDKRNDLALITTMPFTRGIR